MKPIHFVESNLVLGDNGYRSEAVKEIVGLPVYSNGEQCISCWKMSWRERLSAILFGRAWLQVLCAPSQPPVALGTACPFDRRKVD